MINLFNIGFTKKTAKEFFEIIINPEKRKAILEKNEM